MWMLKNKTTGEIIDPRNSSFPLLPHEMIEGAETWDEVFATPIEVDYVDGFEAVDVGSPNDTIREIAEILLAAGHEYSGGPHSQATEIARYWADRGFSARGVSEWVAVRCWDPVTAEALVDLGVSPEMATEASERLTGEDDAYDAMYRVCNGELDPEALAR